MSRSRLHILIAVIASLVLVVGCGGDDDDAADDASPTAVDGVDDAGDDGDAESGDDDDYEDIQAELEDALILPQGLEETYRRARDNRLSVNGCVEGDDVFAVGHALSDRYIDAGWDEVRRDKTESDGDGGGGSLRKLPHYVSFGVQGDDPTCADASAGTTYVHLTIEDVSDY